ncbi:HAMP domain-containing protein [Agrobacterium sp. a22-2]|uniref:methyl-accepting chemotaxis protein n=1 Tax=Agrobacterium sp. a22-2 TaxID=2283840 RepID=UPI001447B4C6|nr:methyl-accepting chemotaxis protein [Agrobacterium sp. a22-2]NKN39634.1 HAMP domain-containing protein [Agrobacterium sp. a22-2]
MSRPKIKTVLISTFVLIGMMFGGFAWVTNMGITKMSQQSGEIVNSMVPKLMAAQDIRMAFTRMNFGYARHVIAETPEDIAGADAFMAERDKELGDAFAAVRAISTSAKDKELLTNIEKGVESYRVPGDKIKKLVGKENAAEAALILNKEMLPQIALVKPELVAIIDHNLSKVLEAYQVSQQLFATTVVISQVATGLCLLILIAAGIYSITGIAQPVQKITASMKDLAAGNCADTIPFAGRNDEIGAMAAAVEIFREAAIDNRRLTEESETARRDNELQRHELRKAAAEEARRQLLEATSALANGLNRLAAGDLSYQITETVSEDFTSLCKDFNAAVLQLSETLLCVAAAAGAIDNGTQEIASSADDLAKRTEQQAASLEQTAAALDQITVNVGNSTKRADEAQLVAAKANDSARKSGDVVSEAVLAMSRIEESSKQISNIIGVIDEIAFQTNLLALNAGVEAARAGEAGRGFAVVAQEVRELAQRSAKAAKEIKVLIQKSAVEVESGVRLVSGTGEALKTIESYIVTINEHMNSIAISAREQATGLKEVNIAVNQMDQVTQRNAAMVEESNAASTNLASESSKLRDLIGHFKLAGISGSVANDQSRNAPRGTAARPRVAMR